MNKQELRTEMRALRRALSPQEQRKASLDVCERLRGFAPYAGAECIMAYIACRGELSLEPVIAEILLSGRTLVLPRCEAPGVMTARRIDDLSQLAPGSYGLMEPDAACEIMPPEAIDLILVPGTAFGRDGSRIGQGGGYYDRFLPKTHAFFVGVCHGQALLECVPSGAHDVRMDAVMTPEEILRFDEHRRSGHGQDC